MENKEKDNQYPLFYKSGVIVLVFTAVLFTDCFAQNPVSKPQKIENKKSTLAITGYAPVNGLNMYYEIHGTGKPLVLIHGAYSAIGSSFGKLLPTLAKTRQVIAMELQGHGRTADIDRPITYEQLADDVAALLRYLKIENADLFGYSMGGGVALQAAIRHPALIRKLVIASASYNTEGWYPELIAMIPTLTPEVFEGSPFKNEYDSLAPNPKNWPRLVDKLKQLDTTNYNWRPRTIQSIQAPALIIIGDSDAIRPEHALQMFKLFGGGVFGDIAGLPNSQLAVLPGTTHVGVVMRSELLLSMIPAFLDAPVQEGK